LRAKLTKKLGREPSADELTTASSKLKAKKQATAHAPVTPMLPAPVTPTLPAAATSAQKRSATDPAPAAAPKKPRVAKNSKTSAQKRSATDPDPAAAPKKPRVAKNSKKAKKAKVLDDGLFGLTSLRGVVKDVVFAELLTVAAAAKLTLTETQVRLTLTEKQLQLAEKQVQLAKDTARADRLRADLRDSTKDRLVLRGIVDLRSILDDVLPKSKKVRQLTNWLLSEQAFVARCKAEDKITKDFNGKKVEASDIATRLSAIWAQRCSRCHPPVTAISWADANVGRVLPLNTWLTDSTDLLLMYNLLEIKGYPVARPRLIDPTPTSPEAA